MYQYHTLSNGIKIILSQTKSRVAYSGVYVNVGSRDESGADEGMAHFIEHSLFKGTSKRKAYHILNRIDGVGGELNAFTTKEETCIYATSLSSHIERCLELFADILFCSSFPENEIEREKDVVIEEINSYNDSPSELIFDQYEELAFEGHALSHNILGTKRNVRNFTSARLREYMHSRYTPSRMVISVVADVQFSRLVRLCEKYFASFDDHPSVVCRDAKPVYRQFDRLVHRRTHQSHLLIGCNAPHIYSDRKTAFSLLNNILGGPAMNSRLNVAIREKYGFCYSIESQYVPFSDAGLFYIYAGVDSDARERAVSLIRQELLDIASSTLSERQLRLAQRQFVGQMAINNDNGSNEMQSIGKAYLNFDHVDTLEDMEQEIMSVSREELLQTAQTFFLPENISTLAYC